MQTVDRESKEHRVVDGQDREVGRAGHVRLWIAAGVILLAALLVFAFVQPATDTAFFRCFLAIYTAATIWWVCGLRWVAGHSLGQPNVRRAAGATASPTEPWNVRPLGRRSEDGEEAVAFERSIPLGATLAIAIGLRLCFFAADPRLSADVYRYLWDGRVSAKGINPYSLPPASRELPQPRPAWHSRINHPEIASIYPPLAQALFVVTAMAPGSELLLWRLVLLAADLATIAMLHRRGRGLVALLWATSPLVLVEGFWSGHIEIVAIPLLVGASLALTSGRDARSGMLAAMAAGLKIVPIAAVPGLLKFAKRRGSWMSTFLLAAAIPFLFFAGRPLMPGLRDYATRWSFNSPLYAAALGCVERLGLANRLKDFWTVIKNPLRLEGISPWVYVHLYDEYLARVVLAILLVLALGIVIRRATHLDGAIASSVGALLLCSPTIHPWYWLTVLPFALLARSRFWTLLAIASPFSYLLYAERGMAGIVLLVCYAAPLVVAACLSHMRRQRSHENHVTY